MELVTPIRHRWFQFGLREFFWITALVALAIFGFREYRLRVTYEQEVAQWMAERNKWYDLYSEAEPVLQVKDYHRYDALREEVQKWTQEQGWGPLIRQQLDQINATEWQFLVVTIDDVRCVRVKPKTGEVIGWSPVD